MSIKKIGLGCSKIGSVSGIAGSEAEKLLQAAFDEGIRHFDTANIYGQGESERLLGNLKKNTNGQIVVATKAGYSMPSLMVWQNLRWIKTFIRSCVNSVPLLKKQLLKARGAIGTQKNFQEDYIVKEIEGSLKRLGQTTLDEFLLHNPSPEELSKGEVFTLLANIKKRGLAKKTGLTLMSPEDQKYITPDSGIDLVQVELNLLSEGNHFALISELKKRCLVEIIVIQPFAGGKLLELEGRMTDRQKAVARIANKNGLDIKELALKFLLQCPFISRVLFGTTNIEHLRNNLRFAKEDKLDPLVLDEVEAFVSENHYEV